MSATFANRGILEGSRFIRAWTPQGDASGFDDFLAWVSERREEVEADLRTAGAALLRGFPLQTDRDFDAVIRALGIENFPYESSLSNAVRRMRTERVFTANEAPPEVEIFLHHELAQTPSYPRRLYFFCERPADTGGATPLLRSDWLWESLRTEVPDLAQKFHEHGLRYRSTMAADPDPRSGQGRGWRQTLGVTHPEEAQARLDSLGYEWTWRNGDLLELRSPRLPATLELSDGRTAFFNQFLAAAQGWKDARNDPTKALCFGNGEPISSEMVETVAKLAEPLTEDLAWRKGDLAILDNEAVMHGRRPFAGQRVVLASLGH